MPSMELTKTLSVGHDLVVMHRLMEMGYFRIEELARNMLKLLVKQYCK